MEVSCFIGIRSFDCALYNGVMDDIYEKSNGIRQQFHLNALEKKIPRFDDSLKQKKLQTFPGELSKNGEVFNWQSDCGLKRTCSIEAPITIAGIYTP